MATANLGRRFSRSVTAARRFFEPVLRSWTRKFAVFVIAFYVLLAAVGPNLPIAEPFVSLQTAGGQYVGMQGPSVAHPFGTTPRGYSVLSQTVHSFRTSMFIGVSAAVITLGIGMNVGLVAGYYGGRVESALMALTDLVYGLPLYPLAIVVLAMLGQGTLKIIAVLGFVLWRTLARVTRSETLSVKEQEYVKSARAAGSTDLRIMYSHILPNLLPILVVYFVFGVTWSVMLEASLSFLGLGDPETVSWGIMLHNAFNQAVFSEAWWWVAPPAASLSLLIWSLFVTARSLEENIEIGGREARRM